MAKKLLFLLVALGTLWSMPATAQLNCGTDQVNLMYMIAHPEALAKKLKADSILSASLTAGRFQRAVGDTEYVIPLVFHIIHNYGAENISDSQIYDAVRVTNLAYSKLDPDVSAIIPAFQNIAANTHIRFVLANKDPNGNCTNGIEHIASLQTYSAGEAAKLNPWPHDVYMNVWVVAKLPDNVAGYALFPGSVEGLGGLADGVIILHDYVGSIGTSEWSHSKALPHELGHTLSLAHTWGGTNQPGVACGDDGIFDTPETMGWSRCPSPSQAKVCHPVGQNGPSDTGVIENYQNYMDYSYCSNMFTAGQRDAMVNTLNNSIAGRNNLWTPANLAFTGVDYDPPIACSPKADFYSNNQLVCQGETVQFKNVSYRGAASYEWTFDDGSDPATSTSANPTVTYNTPGWHTATLIAMNAEGALDTFKRTEYVYVSKSFADYNGAYSDGFEDSTLFANDWLSLNTGNNASHWQLDQTTGVVSHNSVYLNNYNNVTGDIDELVSPTLDLSQETPGSFFLTFDYASATKASTLSQITDTMSIFYSINCGKTWVKFSTLTGSSLITNGVDWNAFKLEGNSKPFSVAVPSGAYTGNTKIKFRYRSGGNGNNIYLDNINISTFTGVDDIATAVNEFTLFPNPATSTVQLNYSLVKDSKVKIEMYDAMGRVVNVLADNKEASGSHSITIDETTIGSIAQGIYIVKLTADGTSISKRLAITK